MRAHQIMTKYVTAVTPHTSIQNAANIMLRCHVSGVPVVKEDGSLVGIVSESDFLRRKEIGTGHKRPSFLQFAGVKQVHDRLCRVDPMSGLYYIASEGEELAKAS
jgi:CBS-domain-containing membrane protein